MPGALDRAAVQLRHGAIVAGYAGLPRQDVAFTLALLDELARHVRDLPVEVRAQVVASADALAGG